MNWFGWLLLGLYVFTIGHNLVRIGQGGYTYKYTPGFLAVSVVLQSLTLLGLLLVGTGSL
jgi:hypothetical protein